MSRVDKVQELAQLSFVVATQASYVVQAQTLILQSLFAVLRERSVLPPDAISTIFRRAAEEIDAMAADAPDTEDTLVTAEGVRAIIVRMAGAHDVKIPTAGVTGTA